MAIRRMVSKERWEASPGTVEVVADYPGADGLLYMETSHKGLVLGLTERNWRDDSDFLAVVWDVKKSEPHEIEYASTRGWTYPNGAAVDATPEVVAAYEAHCEAARKREHEAREAADAALPKRGRRVRVVRGRKVPRGTEGEVIWYGAGKNFGPVPRYRGGWSTAAPMRVGIKDAAGTVHWTAASNVEVVISAESEAA